MRVARRGNKERLSKQAKEQTDPNRRNLGATSNERIRQKDHKAIGGGRSRGLAVKEERDGRKYSTCRASDPTKKKGRSKSKSPKKRQKLGYVQQ